MVEPLVRLAVRGGPHRGVSRSTLERRALKMLRHLELSAELSLSLVADAEMQGLNRDYRQKDRPTDVLAFALREGEGESPVVDGREVLGDVVISVDTARRQAASRRRPLLDELTLLLAHGLLHLLGYDHETDAEEAEMNAATRDLVAAASRRKA
ncbi:MAG: rRNA maturation RNase YbeY [Polyangiaceae bacterium]